MARSGCRKLGLALLALCLVGAVAGTAPAGEKLDTKVYQVKYAEVVGVAETLSAMVSKPESVSVNEEAGTVIVTASRARLATMDTVVDQIDRQTPQILVEVRIYEIVVDNEFELGVNWSISKLGSIGVPGVHREASQTTILPGTFAGVNAGAMGQWGFIHGDNHFDLTLRALEQNTGTDLLANPRLLVLDNVTAEIKIIEEVPYQKQIDTPGGGGGVSPMVATAFQEAGVMLKVTPHVADNDLVRMRLRPDLSAVQAQRDPNGQPIFDRRVADTTLLVKDGDTVVLGGLRRKTKRSYYARAPFFGHIPCLGWAFRYKRTQDVQTELVIFVTPRVVKDTVLNAREQKLLSETELDDVRGQKKIHYLDLNGGVDYGPCPIGPNL